MIQRSSSAKVIMLTGTRKTTDETRTEDNFPCMPVESSTFCLCATLLFLTSGCLEVGVGESSLGPKEGQESNGR